VQIRFRSGIQASHRSACLVKEIVLTDGVARIRGGHRPLVGAIRLSAEKKNPITSKKVIGFNSVWRPLADALRTFQD
jgi:cysteine sulfinate desulfinase/cysteine desulfurase-like protein